MSTGFELSAVVKRFGSRRHPHVAVDGVDDRFAPGRTYGIIGQSGSGKSTLGRILCGLETASSGSVRYDGEELADVLRSRDRRMAFRRAVQMISQDTTSSFDPKRSLRESIVFPAVHLLGMSTRDAWERADEALLAVGLDPTLAARAPGAVSGGQRQRFSIARALVVRPSMLICDEVVSALDVSVQGGILNFLKQYVADTGAGIVFISHGLPATAFVSDELRVMYRGRFVERGDARTVVTAPRHEYTTRLLAGYAPTTSTKEAAVA
ncbi:MULTISPECIES: ATP-binding cassette domain-containing protein [Curtobacterium]|uniref:ABC transporter ATP-binding protein n=1 Tax=Curtobacterium flaccumfaciens TaxID=2035 RepID=UPI003EE70F0B